MDSFKHKITYVIIGTIATYFGFQALELILDVYQVQTFFAVSWYVYFFHVFWLVFIFDLHFKHAGHLDRHRDHFESIGLFWQALKSRARHLYHWSYVRRYLSYLILPSVQYWSVVVLMYLNPFHELFKDGMIILSTAGMSVTYWYFKESFSHHMELHSTGLKILSLIKVFAAYLAYTALMAVGWYFGLSLSVVAPLVFMVSFLLLYQKLFQHRLMQPGVYPLLLLVATLIASLFAVVYQTWNVNYYTAGLMIVVLYTVCWSIIHKYLERELSWPLFWEHVFMLVVLVSLILSTHDFQGRI